jgi:nicotinamide-nucleotide amidase
MITHVRQDDRQSDDGVEDLEQRIAETLTRSQQTAAAAESLTGGQVSAGLSAISGASDWFLGGVVAYAAEVKFDLLGVARLLHADFAVATTGVGGPGPQEGRPEGTVFIAVASPGGCTDQEYAFDGDPGAIIAQATRQALHDLAAAITAATDQLSNA